MKLLNMTAHSENLLACPDLRVLSVRQPWAWMIIHGGKDVENRNRPTKLRGRVLIHASKGMTRMEYEDACDWVSFDARMGISIPDYDALDRGGIIGSVEIVGCIRHPGQPFGRSPWFFGPYGYALANPQPIQFIPCRGALGFWRWNERS